MKPGRYGIANLMVWSTFVVLHFKITVLCFTFQKLQNHLVKKDDNDMSESSMSGTASLLDDLDDLIVDPYENEEEDEQKSRYIMNNISSFWLLFYGLSYWSTTILMNREQNGATSQMAPDQIMDNCPVDQIAEESSLCGNTLSSTMEPCPGNLCS